MLFRLIHVNRVIWVVLGHFWPHFGLFRVFRVISGYFGSFRDSIGGFVKRVISGYLRESCYFDDLHINEPEGRV